jgi:hypothetical protein
MERKEIEKWWGEAEKVEREQAA